MSKEQETIRRCFIITPIGEVNSEIRRAAEGVIYSVIKPVLTEMGFTEDNILPAHEITNPGSINNQIIRHIINDDLVVANLSGVNPNVMYELAIRHVTRKPIIHICEAGTKLPFDIIDQRTIFYNDDMYGVQELKMNFSKMVEKALEVPCDDNPIYDALKTMKLLEDESVDEPLKYLLKKIEGIEEAITKLEISSSRNNKLSYDYTDNRVIFKDIKMQLCTLSLEKKLNFNKEEVLYFLNDIPYILKETINVKTNRGNSFIIDFKVKYLKEVYPEGFDKYIYTNLSQISNDTFCIKNIRLQNMLFL